MVIIITKPVTIKVNKCQSVYLSTYQTQIKHLSDQDNINARHVLCCQGNTSKSMDDRD